MTGDPVVSPSPPGRFPKPPGSFPQAPQRLLSDSGDFGIWRLYGSGSGDPLRRLPGVRRRRVLGGKAARTQNRSNEGGWQRRTLRLRVEIFPLGPLPLGFLESTASVCPSPSRPPLLTSGLVAARPHESAGSVQSYTLRHEARNHCRGIRSRRDVGGWGCGSRTGVAPGLPRRHRQGGQGEARPSGGSITTERPLSRHDAERLVSGLLRWEWRRTRCKLSLSLLLAPLASLRGTL